MQNNFFYTKSKIWIFQPTLFYVISESRNWSCPWIYETCPRWINVHTKTQHITDPSLSRRATQVVGWSSFCNPHPSAVGSPPLQLQLKQSNYNTGGGGYFFLQKNTVPTATWGGGGHRTKAWYILQATLFSVFPLFNSLFPIYPGICNACLWAPSLLRFPTLAECALTPFR